MTIKIIELSLKPSSLQENNVLSFSQTELVQKIEEIAKTFQNPSLLNQKNLERASKFKDQHEICICFDRLQEEKKLNQENMGYLIQTVHKLVIHDCFNYETLCQTLASSRPDLAASFIVTFPPLPFLSPLEALQVIDSTQDTFNKDQINESIEILKRNDLLNKENTLTTLRHKNPVSMAETICLLQQENLLEFLEDLTACKRPFLKAQALVCLKEHRLSLTKEIVETLSAHPHDDLLYEAFLNFKTLKDTCDLNELLPLLLIHETPSIVIEALNLLAEKGFDTSKYFSTLCVHPHPYDLAQAFVLLKLLPFERRIENYSFLGSHSNPLSCAKALGILYRFSKRMDGRFALTPEESQTNYQLFATENAQVILYSQFPYELLEILAKIPDLTLSKIQKIKKLLETFAEPSEALELAKCMIALLRGDLLSEEILKMVWEDEEFEYPEYKTQMICDLHNAGLLTEKHLSLISPLTHHQEEATQALITLHQAQLLTPENKKMVFHLDNGGLQFNSIVLLQKNGLLTQERLSLICMYTESSEDLNESIEELGRLGTADKEHLLSLFTHPEPQRKALVPRRLELEFSQEDVEKESESKRLRMDSPTP